jgi:ABC-type polysaccharide/polyol phosphate export permease
MDLGILVLRGLCVLLDNPLIDIHDPYFANVCLGIPWQLFISVVVQRGFRYFDKDQHIIRRCQRIDIVVVARAQDGNIRLWLAIIIELDRILNAYNPCITDLLRAELQLA